ncbi:MAG: hypothetical protein RSF13_03110 [Clostridiales bacterium]
MVAKEDLIGKRIGNLEILELLPEKKNENFEYRCKCDCGNYINVRKGNLTKKRPTKSCGCKGGNKTFKSSLHYINGTQLEKIAPTKPLQKNNKSKIAGVYFFNGRWFATLHFKGKRVLCKSFKYKSDAIIARLEAEKRYFDKYLQGIKIV